MDRAYEALEQTGLDMVRSQRGTKVFGGAPTAHDVSVLTLDLQVIMIGATGERLKAMSAAHGALLDLLAILEVRS